MGHAEDWLPAHSSHVLLDKMAKVDLMTFDLGSSLTLELWADRRLTGNEMDGGAVTASRKIVYQIGGRKAVAYVSRLGLASKVEIAMAWTRGGARRHRPRPPARQRSPKAHAAVSPRNCNLDYYAVDFNQYSSSSCTSSVNDTGQSVYAAAAGTATTGFDAGGYGNYVLVSHSNGYKTRYAHLQSVNVTNNQAVTTQTIVGFVGDTGSATGAPHLHFGYQTGGVSYCNRAGGCPNGEAARSPQTQKPSPMQTNLGSKAITDFGCNQAPP